MSHVADKNGILAATRYCAAADCGSGEGASSPHRRYAHREPMSIARRTTPVAVATRYWRSQQLAGATACCHSRTSHFAHRVMAAVILRCQGAQHRERLFLSQPVRALTWRAVCCVRLLMKLLAIRLSWQTTPTKSLDIAKGMAIRFVAFLACGIADTLPRSGRLRKARHGRHSRTAGSLPPCHAAYPAKPSARPCGTQSEVP